MSLKLRPYQAKAKNDIYQAWESGASNVLAVMPTGAGKTVLFSDILHDHKGAACAIAHRQELVSQISLALARDEVRHRIIGPKNVVKLCVNLHMQETGRAYYDPAAPVGVAGVDTLVRRGANLASWLKSISLWVQDEAHHVLISNKWGTAAEMFPNAKGLGVTATPIRADGKGLGRIADGLFDTMVEGPTMRELIDAGYLTDYRIYAPPNDLDLSEVTISKTTGDYNPFQIKRAVQKSHIIGDVVAHYLKIARNKLGVTFASDVETATDIAAQFNEAGVPAAVVSAKTPDSERISILRQFKDRKLLQLVNVDLFGEGFDLPAIEVVSMARPTQSYALFAQQFGRALRILEGKTEALIIDHVGNVIRHGLPDAARVWSLEGREKRSRVKQDDEVIPVRSCPSCTAVFERINPACPFCGYKPEPQARSAPEFVDGDLFELDAETLARMRGDVERVDKSVEAYNAELLAKRAPAISIPQHLRRHEERQEMQAGLRASIAWWAGYQRQAGRSDSESYRLFYHTFGVDVLSAQALNTREASALAEKINYHLGRLAS